MKQEIPAIYHPSTYLHQPEYEVFNGEKRPHQDNPKRVAIILQALQSSGFVDVHISRVDNSYPIVARVHDKDYLKYLEDTAAYAGEVASKKGKSDFAIYPSIHPYVSYAEANDTISRRGLYTFDTYTPIMRDTYEAALDSTGVAVAGAMLLKAGEPLVYCLNRPPGHHALRAMSGGMCYLNNMAVAAEYLLEQGSCKLAIFDIDYHHGNGTQDIFYENPNVLVVNIHGDPKFTYPHFTGYANEVGAGAGYGANRNFPLPPNTGPELYDETAGKALSLIRNFQPDYLLISAGFDTNEKDPIGNFKLTTPYYKQLGKRIKKLDLPVLVIQEGGYLSRNLGQNVVSFLNGLSRH
jgi:acetoin utilization deacetylase AcuC-like enzyme